MTAWRLRRLWAVLAVYETGSALAAAERIHMSQPAVTGAVAATEADLNVALFERTSRGMTPTAAGHAVCARIKAAATHLQDAEAWLQQRSGAKTPFRRHVSEVQLRALSAVIETGGFSPAARRLGLSQPSVHRAARELESLCGVALWRREGSQVEATPDARQIARLSDLCFAELRLARDDLMNLQGIAGGTLDIGALPLARSKWLPDAIAATLADFPQAQVRIMDGPYDEQLNALRHARIDLLLGAMRSPLPASDMVQAWSFDDPLVILVRADHPFAAGFDSARDKLTPAQLDSLGWILPRQGTPGRRNFEAFMANKGLAPPARVIECASLVTTRALLLNTDYAALLSRYQVEPELRHGELKIMGPPLSGSTRPIGIAMRQSFRPTRLYQVFLDHLRRLAQDY